MGIKTYKPVTPSRRYYTNSSFEEITKKRPEKRLTTSKTRIGGRNSHGHITLRRRGGGAKKLYRIIDFKRDKRDVPARVAAVEYDPNRSCRIALLHYVDGEKRYILAPEGLKVGQEVMAGEKAEVSPGNALPLKKIPVGTLVHNVEMKLGKGGQIARAAGAAVQLMAKEGRQAILKMPSSEMRYINVDCYATVGQVGNTEHKNISLGKAGRTRWMGRRPKVRGSAMNPIDHPHGGGEGKSKGGRHPVTPWGKPTKGYKTRRNKRTQRSILKRRG
ncbi:MAG: 50S ribosomal protein L2 [Acidobacteriota bacterium]|jgi:large subunit ribosomal protein L2